MKNPTAGREKGVATPATVVSTSSIIVSPDVLVSNFETVPEGPPVPTNKLTFVSLMSNSEALVRSRFPSLIASPDLFDISKEPTPMTNPPRFRDKVPPTEKSVVFEIPL